MERLPTCRDVIPPTLQMRVQRHVLGDVVRPRLIVETVASRSVRSHARPYGSTGWVAQRGRSVRVGEGRTEGRQSINVGRLTLMVGGMVAHPRVEIVDGEEEDVGTFFVGGSSAAASTCCCYLSDKCAADYDWASHNIFVVVRPTGRLRQSVTSK